MSSHQPQQGSPVKPRYEAPAIVWEQEFVALAQASPPPNECNPCGPSPPCPQPC